MGNAQVNRRQLFSAAAAGAAVASAPAAAAQRRRRSRAVTIETTDHLRLHYRDIGEGPSLVFLAAWALPSDVWAYQTAPLSEQGFRCIAYDRRGHGRSEDRGGGYDFDTLADDLAAVLNALDVEGATLIGHSMASGELVRYMTRHGGARVAKLLLIAPAATPCLSQYINPAVFEAARRNQLMRDFPKSLRENLRPLFATPDTSQAMLDWVFDLMLRTTMEAAIGCHRAFTSADFRAELPRLSVPTRIIHGTSDASAPIAITGRPTAASIPGAQLVEYEGAPHGLILTHLERVNADIAEFAGR
jgi:pimeloyl-ACP methyl ester carboxylesterase